MNWCEQVERSLNEGGVAALDADPKLKAHAEQCEVCSQRLQAHGDLNELLGELPEYQPSQALKQRVIGQAQQASPRLRPPPRTLRLAVAASFAVVMVAAIGITMDVWIELDEDVISQRRLNEPSFRYSTAERAAPEEALAGPKDKEDDQLRDRRAPAKPQSSTSSLTSAGEYAQEQKARVAASPIMQTQPNLNTPNLRSGRHQPEAEGFITPEPQALPPADELVSDAPVAELERIEVTGARIKRADIEGAQPTFVIRREAADGNDLDDAEPDTGLAGTASGKALEDETQEYAELDAQLSEVRQSIANEASINPEREAEFRASRERQAVLLEQARQELAEEQRKREEMIDQFHRNQDQLESAEEPLAGDRLSKQVVDGLVTSNFPGILGDSKDFANLTFQDPTGYWSSPYVPGDPEIRALSARLSQIESGLPEQWVVPYDKGFDAPDDAALNLHLRSDVSAIEGPTRVRLQVGVQAVEHRAGRRPAMNLAAVLDIPADADDALRIQARALLDALAESQQAGDHFVLLSTRGGKILEGNEFRYGPLQLAYREQFEQLAGHSEASLDDTVQEAYARLEALRDPNQALGSSSVLLISAGAITAPDSLANMAHDHALQGTTLSVFPLGGQPDLDAVDQLVRAGLGQRRLLSRANQAQDLIEEELASASRAVARSARLSIRLSPHVRLIDVLDSQRLDEPQSQRVRDIEQSMDQRLQRNRGIVADRGEDEDGIQIVIPSIYTGDGVSVLVDVLVDKPGPVAEVTLRYKDLVFMNNGSERAQLKLAAGRNQPGPMQRLVQKDLLAQRFAVQVRAAARALSDGQPGLALAELESLKALLSQARQQVPAWRSDMEIQRDIEALNEYIRRLREPISQSLTDSLKYAAWRKTHQAHEE